MNDYTTTNMSFGAILELAHNARTKRLNDNEILRIMTRVSKYKSVRADTIELEVAGIISERQASPDTFYNRTLKAIRAEAE